MKHALTVIFLTILLLTGCKNENTADIIPDIVLINVDDLGWADLGYMGSEYYESPRIDALASEGLVFMKAYAGAANCAPSRACLMTGMNTPRHGIYTVGSSERGNSKDRKIIPVENKTILHDSLTTLAEALSVYGYTTCQAGKWHLSEDSRDHGFDYNIGGGHNGHPRSYYPPYGNVDLDTTDSKYLTDNIMDRVLNFIGNRTDKPFFLYYAPYAVHTPIHPVDSLRYKFADKKGPDGMSNEGYATMILNLDRNIGRLIDKLKEEERYDNTLIIFTSDNGGLFRISRQKPLRAGKGSYYEGGIRVPLFFIYKGRIEPGIDETNRVVNLDLFPTILELIGADLPGKKFDGISLAPLLLDDKEIPERTLIWHFPIYLQKGNIDTRDILFRTRPGSVIIDGNWKLQLYYEDGALELFNLEVDPGEQRDLSAIQPEKVKELLGKLEALKQEMDAPVPFKPNPGFNSDTK